MRNNSRLSSEAFVQELVMMLHCPAERDGNLHVGKRIETGGRTSRTRCVVV